MVKSLPSRERGLKSYEHTTLIRVGTVAPFAGAWIEMEKLVSNIIRRMSLPSRERGLKFSEKLTKNK